MLSVSQKVDGWSGGGTDSCKLCGISDGVKIAHLLLHVFRAWEIRVKIKRETART